jgi:hypothetical protein
MECQFLYCGDTLELLPQLHSVPDRRLFTNFYRHQMMEPVVSGMLGILSGSHESMFQVLQMLTLAKALLHLPTQDPRAMHLRVIKYYVVHTMLMEPFSSRVALTAMQGSVLNFQL